MMNMCARTLCLCQQRRVNHELDIDQAHRESFRNHTEALQAPAVGLKVDAGLLRQPRLPGGKPLFSTIANIRILQVAEATDKTSTYFLWGENAPS